MNLNSYKLDLHYGQASVLPKTVAKARRDSEAAMTYALLGVEVILADDLPEGVEAVLGHRNADGSFVEGAVRIVTA